MLGERTPTGGPPVEGGAPPAGGVDTPPVEDSDSRASETEDPRRVELVRNVDPDHHMAAVPLVQNVPNCIVRRPRDGGARLSNGSEYRVVAIRVLDDAWEDPTATGAMAQLPIDLSTLRPSVRVDLCVEGDLSDALDSILGIRAEVEDGGTYLFAPGEHTNTAFKKWHPADTTPGRNVRIEGLGVHHLRVIPRNGSGVEGRYHLDVACELSEEGAAAVAGAHRHLADLVEEGANLTGAALQAHTARVIAATHDVVAAWRAALADIQVRALHNVHVAHDTRLASTCRFRVRASPAGADAGRNDGQVRADPQAAKGIEYEDELGRFISALPAPSFFVAQDTYSGPKTFEHDGLLRGEPDDITHGSYPTGGAEDHEITYGVAAHAPGCAEIEPGQTVELRAYGLPARWKQLVGEYEWSMVSHPPGAKWTFDPPGPTPQNLTKLGVDRSGRYVVRVDYTLDADVRQHCNQTYAIVDLRIIVRAEVGMDLRRVGTYPPEIAAHVGRPFYRRRTLERQEGADLVLRPVGATDMGHRQRFQLRVSPELRLSPELTARVYTAPDWSTHRDYVGPPSIVMPHAGAASVDLVIDSLEPIYAIHIMRTRYAGLLELPGHAAEVFVEPLGGEECVLAGTRDDVARPGRGPEGTRAPLHKVNLLLYEHDLGDAESGPGLVPLPGSDLFAVNVANGNLHLHVPFFEWQGRGMSLECDASWNSFHAAKMAAVERMGRINGVPTHELDEEYARNVLGYGWSYTYGLHLMDYVLSEGGRHIRKRLELIAPDGNHIQLEAEAGLGDRYVPAGRGTTFLTDPQVGGSLVVVAQRDGQGRLSGYEMSDLHGHRWRFDARGRVTEIASSASARSGGALAPIRIAYSAGSVTITDSVGRELTAATDARGRILSLSDQDARTWELRPSTAKSDLLGEIGWPRRVRHAEEKHVFEYDPRWCFLASLTNRRGFVATAKYVESGDGWGRIRELTRPKLRWSVAYDPVKATQKSTAEVMDTRGTLYRYTWDRDSLASLLVEAYRLEDQSPVGILAEGWVRVTSHRYYAEAGRGEGKLPTRSVDVYGFVRTMAYQRTPDGRGYHLERTLIGDQLLHRYTVDAAANRVHEQTDANGRVTVFEYDAYANQSKITYPLLRGQTEAVTEEWVYHADGRLRLHKDRGGKTTVYGYGGAGDSHGTGRPTSKTLAGVVWTYEYHRSGRVRSETDPIFGGKTEYGYDVLDREEIIKSPAGTVIDGGDLTTARVAQLVKEIAYDPNGNVVTHDVPLGGKEEFTFDQHDRQQTHVNSDGTIVYDAYDGFDEIVQQRDRRDRDWTTARDYLGRENINVLPKTNAGALLEQVVHIDDGKGHVVHYVAAPYDPSPGAATGWPRQRAVTTYGWHGEILERRRWMEKTSHPRDHSPVAVWTYERDRYGHLESLSFTWASRVVYQEMYELDEWYRKRAVTVAGATTSYELGLTDEILAVTAPPHGGGGQATWRFTYDDLLREKTTTDPYGAVVREVNYYPPSGATPARVEHLGIRLDVAVPRPLVNRSAPAKKRSVLKTVVFDGRGLPVTEEVAGLPPTDLYYDLRHRLLARETGPERVMYQLDGQGRRTSASVRDRVQETTTVQRFDPAGNLTFQSGRKFDVSFEYNALDHLTKETRTPAGGQPVEFRSIEYDIFGRPVKKVVEGAITTTISYYEHTNSLGFKVTGGDQGATGGVTYAWNGQIQRYDRSPTNGLRYSVEASEPDALGRVKTISSSYGMLRGELEIEHYPAGTRKALVVRWWHSNDENDKPEEIRRTYEYHEDWQLKKVIVSPSEAYEFAYQPSGGMSSWRTPRKHQNIVEYHAGGAVSSLHAKRKPRESFLRFDTDFYGAGHPDVGKESTSVVQMYHDLHEPPPWGHTTYSSTTVYDARGLPQVIFRARQGLGELVNRTVVNSHRPDGTIEASEEGHQFPDDPGSDFQVTRSFFDELGSRMTVESAPRPKTDEVLRSLHSANQAYDRDAYGRATRLRIDALLSPGGVASWFVDREKWLRSEYRVRRDELGRVHELVMDQSTCKPLAAIWESTGVHTRTRFVHGPFGEVSGRTTMVTHPVPGTTTRAASYDERLYLYDGADVVAEIGRRYPETRSFAPAALIRYYEIGPGSGFRLAVHHRRSIKGVSAYRDDEYLYGPGMAPLALVGEPNDGSGGASSVVRRFGLWDMPLPGIDQQERVRATDSDNDLLVSSASALSGAAHLGRGGLPDPVVERRVVAIGSTVTERLADESLGALLAHSVLFEDVHEPEPDLTDPGELADLSDPSPGAELIEAIITSLPIVSWIYRLNKSKALAQEGRWDLAGREVDQAAMEIATTLLPGIGAEIGGLAGTLLRGAWSAYTWGTFVLQLPDTLTLLGGHDPETGQNLSWDRRVVAWGSLAIPHLVPGLPQVSSGYGCFPALTPVWTPVGPRAIDALGPGDVVLAPSAEGLRPCRVRAVHAHLADTLAIDLGRTSLEASGTQPFCLAGRGWVEASHLRPGDRLIDGDGSARSVVAVAPARTAVRVYNLTVEGESTYLVGERRIVVHNKPSVTDRALVARAQRIGGSPYFMARWLIGCGHPEWVWQLDRAIEPRFRGHVVEQLSRLLRYERQGFGHVGKLFGGTFEYDFHGGRRYISLKSLQSASLDPAISHMYAIRKHISAVASKSRAPGTPGARRELHVVMPRGARVANLRLLHQQARAQRVTLLVRAGRF